MKTQIKYLTRVLSVLTLSGALLGGGSVFAATQPVGLLEAWTFALESDSQWLSAQANFAAEREILPQAKAALLPSIGTTASYFQRDTETDGDTAGTEIREFDGTSTSYAVELRQPLLNVSATKYYSSAKKTIQTIDYQLELARQLLMLRVSEAYFDLLLAEEGVVLAESELKAIKRQLDQTEQRFKVGLVSKTDVLEAQAAADQTLVLVAQARNQQAIALENLSIIVGRSIQDVIELKESVPLVEMKLDPAAWVNQVLASSLEYKLAQLQQDIAGLSREAVKSSYWPTVDAVANYSNADDFNETNTTQYGLQANWQPFQGGGLRSRVREAELRFQSAVTDAQGLKQTLSRDARNIYQTLQTDIVQIQAQQQSIISNESALEATQAGYEVGTRNIVDVLNAQRAVFQAKRNFADARFTWVLRRLQAAYLDSSLSRENLEEIDSWLKK